MIVLAGLMLISVAAAQTKMRRRHGKVPKTLPPHVDLYARYMQSREGAEASARDIVKAYAITRSSVQRPGVPRASVCRYYPEFDGPEAIVRPEDAFSRLLATSWGQRFLNAAERGRFDWRSARALSDRMGCWGLTDTLMDDLRAAVAQGRRAREFSRKLRAPRKEWVRFVSDTVPGISGAKAGFLAALLGRGDVPTFDAREVDLWERQGDRPIREDDVEMLARRLRQWKLGLRPELEPYRQHLTHHALWDAFPRRGPPTRTTHEQVISAMTLAEIGKYA